MRVEKIIDSIDQEPYYREKEGVLYCADCMDILPQIPEKSIDLVLTDPPYGVNLKYDIYDDSDENWIKMFNNIIPLLKRISTMSILPCCQIRKLSYIYNTFPPDWLICWYKGSTSCPAFVGFNDYEPLLVYGKNKGVMMHDFFYCLPNRDDNDHPCPKPEKWAMWLIKRATVERMIVIDPFLGSGTTAVASKKLGRQWIGIEISQKYCDIAVKRLKKVKFGCSLKNEKLKQITLKEIVK